MFHDFDIEHIQTESPKLLSQSIDYLEQLAKILHATNDERYDDLNDLIQEIHYLLALVEAKGYPNLNDIR